MTGEYLIEGPCSVVISVQAPVIKWAKAGTGISITDERLVIKKEEDNDDKLATGSVQIGGEDGVREGYFEVELTADRENEDMEIMVGIVNTGLDHDTDHYSSNNAWYLRAGSGSLFGNGKSGDDEQGELKVGDKVGVLVDLDGGEGGDGGSVRFFVNGSEYGSGFKSGVTGPVVLGVELYAQGQIVTLLPDAQKPAGL